MLGGSFPLDNYDIIIIMVYRNGCSLGFASLVQILDETDMAKKSVLVLSACCWRTHAPELRLQDRYTQCRCVR